jgi:preprotein translocase subunit SecA
LSESGNSALLQKVEGQYMADNNRDMPIVDKDLYFVIEEKNNQVDLNKRGRIYVSGNSDSNSSFS